MIEQKSVRDIINEKVNFIVPSYQRGYRWDEINVTDLLDDLLEFMQDGSSGKFYCLQPLVVKKIGTNQYNVIDGQQRLTTIFIILKYLEKLLEDENDIKEIYTINYETREGSQEFLKEIASKTQEDSNENIDYFYMYKAYKAVENWFGEKIKEKKTTKRKMLEIFTNSEDEKHIEFIWYEVENSENDEVKIFARLNSGKIPLTNAELIKALFLNVRNFPKECSENEIITKQIEISKEWDEIEYTLQDDEFFKFLTKNDYPTRIELLFEILSGVKSTELDRYAIYRDFAKKAKEKGGLLHLANREKEEEGLWGNIKKRFLTFKFWFKDSEYYHLVGFLVASGISNIMTLYNEFEPGARLKTESETKTKSGFKDSLKKKIKVDTDNIGKLNYIDNRKELENILLLFNIATIINSKGSYTRFSFNEYNGKKWSLEHIHAQNDKGLKDKKAQDAWLENSKKYIDESDLKEKIANFINGNENSRFDELQMEILNQFGNIVNMHGIGNLALLTAENNSSLSNGLFVDKRAKIIEMDKNGEFIPICTKNVFLKYYSKELSDVYFWSKQDQEDYKGSIIKTLENFLGEKNGK
ncbi:MULTISPECIES: DUF262 domain-containing protein [Campylobacter]|uniref:DUF262 domain-containing protein n=1 Tax=Campylobacter TaxID=194 RepID=UPI00146FE422|nr:MULTISPECIES: DUF262 domain-containing protein [Campylobacter]MBN7288321.1 DUF262 domain-containing protein [Campylobacter curvus]MDU6826985.1 DUF262 domain-containing protein [Campylobacter sp.]